jgi:hypothetical protein
MITRFNEFSKLSLVHLLALKVRVVQPGSLELKVRGAGLEPTPKPEKGVMLPTVDLFRPAHTYQGCNLKPHEVFDVQPGFPHR